MKPLCVAAFLVVLAGALAETEPTVYVVAQDGTGDFTTIQEAAEVAQAGDSVLIKAGTYSELVQPSDSGAPGSYITYRNYAQDEVIVDGNNGARMACIKVHDCDYLRFIGLKLRAASWAGFYVEGPASNLILDSLVSEDNIHPTSGAGYGIWFMAFDEAIQDCVIRNCTVRHNSSHGIFLYRSNYNVLIEKNHVSYSGFEPEHWGHNVKTVVWNEHNPATGPVGVAIINNELDHARTQGIMTWNAREVLIRGNHIHHNGATGIQIEDGTEDFVVEDNLCEWNQQSYNTETGIWIDDASSGVVQNNVMRHNQVGLKVSKCDHVIVRNNLIYKNNRDNPQHFHNGGLFLLAYDGIANRDVIMVHNTLYEIGNPSYTNMGLGFYSYYGDRIEAAVFQNNILCETISGYDIDVDCEYHDGTYDSDFNDFYGSEGLRIHWLGDEITWAEYLQISSEDSHSITSDPLFACPDSNDFHLQQTSPCLDGGEWLARTAASGNGTVVPVDDARFFTDGFGVVAGDRIVIGANPPVRVVDVDYAQRLITVTQAVSWTQGDGVSYPHWGAAPDIGALEYVPASIELSAELAGGEVVLTWTPFQGAGGYWVYGACNNAWFIPGFTPGYLHRIATVSPLFLSWSSPAGVGEPDSNWSYLVLAVDVTETELARSNRAGEHDFELEIP